MTTANPAAQPATIPSTTLGAGLRGSPVVRTALDSILADLARASAALTSERPPNPGLADSYASLLARASEVRGRALLYPFIGSGLGNGALVELADGSVKWDMVCGIGVNFFGHSDPDLTRAAIEAGLDDVVKHGNLTSNADAYEFSSLLVSLASTTSGLRHCYLATSGAMANENALKICFQKHSPASRVIAFRDCFMGRSTTMSQIGDAPDYRQGLPLNTLVDYMPFYDSVEAERQGKAAYIAASVARLEEFIHRYPGQHACFIFELIQGEGGFNIADPAWARALMECCRKHRIAVWDDEIQTFGRTARMFAYELMGVGDLVDVLTVGKMTQCCATLFTPEYNPKAGLLSGTFTGETVSFRVGTRVLQRLRDGAYYGDSGSNARHHALFRSHAADLITRHPDWFPPVPALGGGGDRLAGGVGGMMRLTAFGGDKARITAACKACLDEGVIVFYCGHGPYHLRLLPPLGVFKDTDWPRVFAVLERALAKVK